MTEKKKRENKYSISSSFYQEKNIYRLKNKNYLKEWNLKHPLKKKHSWIFLIHSIFFFFHHLNIYIYKHHRFIIIYTYMCVCVWNSIGLIFIHWICFTKTHSHTGYITSNMEPENRKIAWTKRERKRMLRSNINKNNNTWWIGYKKNIRTNHINEQPQSNYLFIFYYSYYTILYYKLYIYWIVVVYYHYYYYEKRNKEEEKKVTINIDHQDNNY